MRLNRKSVTVVLPWSSGMKVSDACKSCTLVAVNEMILVAIKSVCEEPLGLKLYILRTNELGTCHEPRWA